MSEGWVWPSVWGRSYPQERLCLWNSIARTGDFSVCYESFLVLYFSKHTVGKPNQVFKMLEVSNCPANPHGLWKLCWLLTPSVGSSVRARPPQAHVENRQNFHRRKWLVTDCSSQKVLPSGLLNLPQFPDFPRSLKLPFLLCCVFFEIYSSRNIGCTIYCFLLRTTK